MKRIKLLGALMLASLSASTAFAQETSPDQKGSDVETQRRFFIRSGPGRISFHGPASVSIEGVVQPGASAHVTSATAAIVIAGYFIEPNVSLEFLGGLPPTVNLVGRGTYAGFPKFARVVFAPPTASIYYHLPKLGPVHPYLGAGIAYGMIFKNKDRLLQDYHTGASFGPSMGGGAELMINSKFGIHVQYLKAWMQTHVHFRLPEELGGLRGTGKLVQDPRLLTAGVTYHFW